MDGWQVARPLSVRCRRAHEAPASKSDTLSETSLFYFPSELLEEILSRLPVRSLIQFRCVCKWWRNLIDDEKFISLHHKNNKTSYLLMGNFEFLCHDYPIHCFLPACGNDAAGPALQKVAEFRLPTSLNPWRYLMAGVCNGILCLYDHYMTKDIILWNPATKEMKFIPPSTVPRPPRKVPFSVVGFGFDPQRNDYKILQMVYYSVSHVVQLELYSLRANCWRKIDNDAIALRDPGSGMGVFSLPFTQNRVVCCLINAYPGEPEIMCFDMSSEKLETIQIAIPLDEQVPADRRCYNLFPFRASVALGVGYSVHERTHAYSHVYVLNDFFSPQRSWTKLFSVKHHILLRPVASWENMFIFQNTRINPKLMLLDNSVYHDNPVLLDL